jgi:hypothetical protein
MLIRGPDFDILLFILTHFLDISKLPSSAVPTHPCLSTNCTFLVDIPARTLDHFPSTFPSSEGPYDLSFLPYGIKPPYFPLFSWWHLHQS